MSELEYRNAKITSTMLGVEDHGVLTCMLTLDYGGAGQGFGGYAMDTPEKDEEGDTKRVASAAGFQFIIDLMKALEVSTWEALKGQHVRVVADHGRVYRIGHLMKDKWFAFDQAGYDK